MKTMQRIFQWFSLGVIILAFMPVSAFGNPGQIPIPKQVTNERLLTVHLQGVFSAKISLIPFKGLKAVKPLAEVLKVKNGESAAIKIPAQYLPGEFVVRMDYRAKQGSHSYPAEKYVFVNRQDINLFINPLSGSAKFGRNERENTVYNAFMKENRTKHVPVNLLLQCLLSYDRTKSDFYA